MFRPNRYRTHGCGEIRSTHVGETVTLSGWVHRKRNFGGLYFLVLRDHSGIVQVVIDTDAPFHAAAADIRLESVIQIEGEVVPREEGNVNPNMPTGEIEVKAKSFEIHSTAEILPFQIADDIDASETERLKHRFLDLRRDRLQHNMALRSKVISSIRRRMTEMDFFEFQTPILTSSSPEGARDFLVPSRLHPGKFYALPQAPQQFKQLLMVSGFPRYFQIAPCFRDEDARADRSPGEFYQLDMEMAYVDQEDIFAVLEELLVGLFREFTDWHVADAPFPRLTYRDTMLRYGSDKPDLRFGCEIQDISDLFATSEFRAFRSAIDEGGVVRVVPVPGAAGQSRKFFDGIDAFVKEQGGKGCAWIAFPEGADVKGSIAKFLDADLLAKLKDIPGAGEGSALLFVAGKAAEVATIAGRIRLKVADDLDLREKGVYKFCWIVDFPMFEWDEENECVTFSHNPFSMPQGGMEALETQDPLDILAFQYDIVCNGVELSSGAIRNHRPDVMYKAFEIAGHPASVVDEKFGGMIRAFKFGAPPHGGIAPGVDRIVMLIADEPNIREVILFPMNQKAEDLLMGAPSEVRPKQVEELHIRIEMPKED
ncbi:MAG: aspartate--tRNA ligase [Candidatus Eisenbacteria bacterium]|uniref:Aspartate--tRNA(Asp/Asn) ligase n=1 Tax=Eiseniibacteriota bacterium TaxID=2212470 RepID=A0A956NFR9_UNCEI|nr:aspartate--tRNA ligase [Candidatus Eisenbacteria bacterium]MCB9463885.1 aspartate--tRNA ligase [Candidatus Eisenbacteria bacterium]